MDITFNKENIQRRFFAAKLECRAAVEGKAEKFGGVAATVGVEYVLWEDEDVTYSEIISPGAFANAGDFDIRVLKNHDPSYLLARTASGTARVWEDSAGLAYEWDNEPSITYASDLAASIRRGDTRESSFGFLIGNEIWEQSNIDGRRKYKRTILSFSEIFDVSPVTFPANRTTSVTEKRDLENAVKVFFDKNNPEKPTEKINFDLLQRGLEVKRKHLIC